jgi:hypothetical protein
LASCLYIVKEGEVDCVSKGEVVRTLYKGDHFGEKSLLIQSNRTLDVIAKTSCIVYSISVDTLTNMVGEKYKEALYMNFIKIAFAQSEYFNKFNVKYLDEIFENICALNLPKNQLAYPEGHIKSSKLVIVIEGSLINVKIIYINILNNL